VPKASLWGKWNDEYPKYNFQTSNIPKYNFIITPPQSPKGEVNRTVSRQERRSPSGEKEGAIFK